MDTSWMEQELETIDLGDARLEARAAKVLQALGRGSSLSLPAACRGWAETQAAYRFFDNPKVTFERVLQPHLEQSRKRLQAWGDDPRAEKVVLLVQDTTEIDLTRPQSRVAGAGYLDRTRRGILLHPLQAFTPTGLPLGTVHAQCLIRPEQLPDPGQTARQRQKQGRHLPFQEKESMRWLQGLRQTEELARAMPRCRCVCVGDSDSDIYELLSESCGKPPGTPGAPGAPGTPGAAVAPRTLQADFLIRGCHDRMLLEEERHPGKRTVREHLRSGPVLYQSTVTVRPRQAQVSCDVRSRRLAREGRQAQVTVRAATVSLRGVKRPPTAPSSGAAGGTGGAGVCGGGGLPPVSVNVVWVCEEQPPPQAEPIEWLLLTTLPIDQPEQVRRVVEYYTVRWQIEQFFRVLKSGCQIEKRRFEDVRRTLPCLALCMIVAWRTQWTCRMGRECPEESCQLLFQPAEWKALWMTTQSKPLPARAPTLGQVVQMIAVLGGFVPNQTQAKFPGPQTIWVGLQRLHDLAWAWRRFGPDRHAKADDV